MQHSVHADPAESARKGSACCLHTRQHELKLARELYTAMHWRSNTCQ